MALILESIERKRSFNTDIEKNEGNISELTINGRVIKPVEKPTKKITPRTCKMLAFIFFGEFCLGCCCSLIAPIYPEEALKKEASATAFGIVFGVYQLVMFISAPIFGKYINILKPGFMMRTGMLTSGICSILFSFLDSSLPGIPFIALSISIRVVDALGASAFHTASFAVMGHEFPDIIGRVVSLVESSYSVGLVIGPVFGGALYEAGGFSFPFRLIGYLLLVAAFINIFLFHDTENVAVEQISSRKLLSNFDFLIDILAICSCSVIVSFNECSLEPHLRQFHLSLTIVGVIYLVDGLVYGTSSPIWGFISEKVSNAQNLTLFGGLLLISSFLIIGPAPFFTFPASLTLIIISQMLIGLGAALQMISSFTHAVNHTIERGFPTDVGTYGLVAGLLFSSTCFGCFLGPTVGGILIDQVGYRNATAVFTTMEIFVAVIFGSRLTLLYITKRKKPEKTPLIK